MLTFLGILLLVGGTVYYVSRSRKAKVHETVSDIVDHGILKTPALVESAVKEVLELPKRTKAKPAAKGKAVKKPVKKKK